MSATAPAKLRIGELAELTGTTPRTIRYYEEIGLLEGRERAQGKHRLYTDEDVARVKEIVRLRDLLGLSLEQLAQLVEAETARTEIRRQLASASSPEERGQLRERALGHIDTQLKLVRGRRRELEKLEAELVEKRRDVRRKLQP